MTIRPNARPQRFAVLIDAENASAGSVAALFEEVASYGIASVRRAYGDWTTSHLAGWKETLNQHAIQPIQQFRYTSGKNATDSALIIDAMDLLYRDHLDGFCLVSSDSDFTRLATRLRESRMTVIGFGKANTPRAFVAACDKFVYTEILDGRSKEEPAAGAASLRKTARELRADTKLVHLLRTATVSAAGEDGWTFLASVGNHIANQSSDFDSRNYGYPKLLSLIIATELFDVQDRTSKSGHVQKFIRDKRATKPSEA
ncbi:MAG: NYN domain-containing protein [Planctomycetaceae bacterium]